MGLSTALRFRPMVVGSPSSRIADGPFEVLVGQAGTGDFVSPGTRTRPCSPNGTPVYPVRLVGFNADGSEVWLGGGFRQRGAIDTAVGSADPPDLLPDGVVAVAWKPDGKQIVYHERIGGGHRPYRGRQRCEQPGCCSSRPRGTTSIFQSGSRDGQWIYLVRGRPATLEMDLWRCARRRWRARAADSRGNWTCAFRHR